ncbi:OLC1v1002134C1 [Oldenlandia corymbosa var. corymbosa]|uniref:OLC1v1002134C1 n=1 Tax=Oldenlandia corymbosa var. corymbosa TaxID=529605 RepID=A0AAV1DAE1_OLDCO|nr:OLC1v1002134C1 [Oldenlandia corymbosa var. corymbosa]
MPLYDCMLLLKPNVSKAGIIDLVCKVGKHAFSRNGVVTDMKSFGQVHLGYGIKKLDGKFYQGHLMQLTMMTPPSFNSELHYLNKEDRLLRWLLVKHRDIKYGLDSLSGDEIRLDVPKFVSRSSDDEDKDESSEDDMPGYESFQIEQKTAKSFVLTEAHIPNRPSGEMDILRKYTSH